MKPRLLASALLFVSLITILPMLLFDIGGDIDFHLVLIKCFAEQFWQGDVYPRWCMEANTRLGTPALLFYFPLPYYVAALLYPLSHLGISIYGIYVLSIFLATGVTAFTCYLWLKDIVSPGRALLASALFIVLPYRMETMLFRSSYTEIWGMSLLPLVFKYVRRLTRGDVYAALPLAAVFELLFITHLPCAAIAVLAGGVYILGMSGKTWPPKGLYAASVLWGLALAAFYIVPALHYQQFMFKAPLFIPDHARGWPNTFLGMNNVHRQTPVVVMIATIMLALAILSVITMRRRDFIPDTFVRREVCVWSLLFAIALLLLFPVSAPFYALLGPLKQVIFPWRMQNIFMLALAFLLAVRMQWLISVPRMKTWKGDFFMLFALLILMAYFSIGIRDAEHSPPADQLLGAGVVTQSEYRTVWIDEGHFGTEYILPRYAHRNSIHAAEIVSGKGSIGVEHWGWDGIVLKSQSAHGITVRLNQFYFPIWSAQSDDGEPVSLHPEAATGQMLLDITAGKHRILLHYAVSNDKPWLVWMADVISALAASVWLSLLYRRRSAISLL